MRFPNQVIEKEIRAQGFSILAGVDEAGRGPLAGPIVAAAVVLPSHAKIKGLADSKLLSPRKREELFLKIQKKALGIGIGEVSHKLIDKINIGRANLLAMQKAVERLAFTPHFLLIDGERNSLDLPIPQIKINSGDKKCVSIAAASIIAKVTRDRIMQRWHTQYPDYGFDRHKGYGTREHLQNLSRFGSCPIHRKSFLPVLNATKRQLELILDFK
jgi:ribonuclease HII